MVMRMEEFTCKRGDRNIRGTQYIPRDTGRWPIAVISHGFGSNRHKQDYYARTICSKGYAVFTFDFCGGCLEGESDGRTEDMTIASEVADLSAVLFYAKRQSFADPEKVVLMGLSQGGYVSALKAAQSPQEITKLVLFYPALCIPDNARAGKMINAEFDPENIPETIDCIGMKLGRNFPASLLDADPYEEISGYQGPVLLVHGDADELVDISYSVEAAMVYENCTFKIIEGGGHGFEGEALKEAVSCLIPFIAGTPAILPVQPKELVSM